MRVDWQTICNNIRLAGVPLERASRELGKGPEYLRYVRIKRVNPRFDDGCKLLRYHLRLCGNDAHKRVVARLGDRSNVHP